jgi:flagellar biosynthesis component FlhA
MEYILPPSKLKSERKRKNKSEKESKFERQKKVIDEEMQCHEEHSSTVMLTNPIMQNEGYAVARVQENEKQNLLIVG